MSKRLPHLVGNGQGVNAPQLRAPGVNAKLPHLVGNGQGVHHSNTREPGVNAKLPHINTQGQGVNAPQMREPGVNAQLPSINQNGNGVNTASCREPGVNAQRPHIHDQGQGVNAPQMRAPGVNAQRPHIHDQGQGVNAPQMRAPGVNAQRPSINQNGNGVNTASCREPDVWDDEAQAYHEMTMPRLRNWLRWLSARMRHVRILSGDWARALTPSASLTLSCRQGKGVCGVFLDPPYADTAERSAGLYAHDDLQVAHRVREWCLQHTEHPSYRIVLAGFEGEHGSELTDAGWREIEWFQGGHLRGGYSTGSERGHQQARERLWLSPQCLTEAAPLAPAQLGLCWDDEEE